ncbi:hypothetical protein BpHYR1_017574 [Brachionus plicatilis]|uniref:Uncharacterized protein n=1 Tax=Brachionus plicatilis TaxID=10195 RepID=A0A3M7RFA1_BRAPC|nr:hypothetical protein BpHYR1_017574 [Brachionus plicatilis]
MDSREKENQTKNNDNEYSDFIQSQPIEQGSCLNHGNQLLSNKEKKHENQLLYFSGKHDIYTTKLKKKN